MFAWGDFALALALLLVIEGALYSLFPKGMQQAMAVMVNSEPGMLRSAGITAVMMGIGLAWFIGG